MNLPSNDKLNMLGAALVTGSAAHSLLCLATLPALVGAPYAGFVAGAVKVLGIFWTTTGVLAGGYVAVQSLALFNGKDFAKARRAAIGCVVLPLIGLTGGVTAFALLPIGAAAWWFLRQPMWQAAFPQYAQGAASEDAEVSISFEEDDTAPVEAEHELAAVK